MILDLFFFFFLLSGFLIFLGFYNDMKLRYLATVGFSLMFILSAWVMLYQYMPVQYATSGLEYQTGSIVNTSGSVSIITNTYSVYNDATTFWIGFIMSLVSGISTWLVTTYED